MADRFFQVAVRDAVETEEELNRFLRSHRVLAVDRRWVDLGTESFWSICVDYLESAGEHRRREAERLVVEWITARC